MGKELEGRLQAVQEVSKGPLKWREGSRMTYVGGQICTKRDLVTTDHVKEEQGVCKDRKLPPSLQL